MIKKITKKTTKKTTKKAVRKVVKKEFNVMDGSNVIRTYDVETHGKDAGKLAEQFANKKGYKVA